MVLRFAFHHMKKQSVCQTNATDSILAALSLPRSRGIGLTIAMFWRGKGRGISRGICLALAIVFLACNREQKQSAALATAGNVDRGKAAIERYGCNACHNIPGIPGPKGMVGPPLDHMASRSLIGGKLPNNPDTMIKWLQDPLKYDPQATMPNLGVTPADSRDISAYLYTLK